MPLITAPDIPEIDGMETSLFLRSILETGNAALAHKAWDMIEESAFQLFLPLHEDLAHNWRTTKLEASDVRQIFSYQLQASGGVFDANRRQSLNYAFTTRKREIIDTVRQELEITPAELAEALGGARGLSLSSEPELADHLVEMISTTKDETDAWRANVDFQIYRKNNTWLLLLAKCGVDMTRFASTLMERNSIIYTPYLRAVSSQHGRLRLMHELPSVEQLLSAHSRFIEDLIAKIDEPIER